MEPLSRRLLLRSTVVAAAAWLFGVATGVFGDLATILLALGAGVVVPVGLYAVERTAPRGPRSRHEIASLAASLGAPVAVASFIGARGEIALALAFAWLAATVVGALFALARLRRRGQPLHEIVLDLGHLYLVVGAAWLAASRGGIEPLGFREPVVTFTANHFHYAGFAAPVAIGLLGRELFGRGAPVRPALVHAYRIAATVVALGIPLVAAGITISHALEMPAAIALGLGMLTFASLLVITARRRFESSAPGARLAAALAVVAALSLVLSMAFAIAFTTSGSAGRGAGEPAIGFATMVAFHGVANALGFSLLVLVSFAIAPAPATSPSSGG